MDRTTLLHVAGQPAEQRRELADPETARREGIERVPLKRWATPDEIAEMVLFVGLVAQFATGSCLSIDGGTVAG